MSCLPLTGWLKKRSKEDQNSEDNERTKSKYLSRKKIRESIESLPKQDIFERIHDWLEENENDIDRYLYNDILSYDNLGNHEDCQVIVKLNSTRFKSQEDYQEYQDSRFRKNIRRCKWKRKDQQ